MTSFDIGVFVDAACLAGLPFAQRRAADLVRRVEVAAAQFTFAGGISHRLVVADCADPGARAVADDFGVGQGFRIRHLPGAHLEDSAQILAVEILEATAAGADLRTVVVVGDLNRQPATVDALHRRGRAVINFAPAESESSAADLVIPLAGPGVRPAPSAKAVSPSALATQACRHLSRTATGPDELVEAMRAVLGAFVASPELKDIAATTGLTVATDVSRAFHTAVPAYDKDLAGMKLSEILHPAVVGTDWRVMRHRVKLAQIKLVIGDQAFPEFEVIAPV
jgi:hypothetical protein